MVGAVTHEVSMLERPCSASTVAAAQLRRLADRPPSSRLISQVEVDRPVGRLRDLDPLFALLARDRHTGGAHIAVAIALPLATLAALLKDS